MDAKTDKNQQSLIKNIMQVAPKHCENCGNKYDPSDFHIMKNSSVNTLLHLKCSKCGNTYMLNVVSPMQGMVGASRVPLNLDLTNFDEVNRFAGMPQISDDLAVDIFEQTSKEKFANFIKKLLKSN